MTSKPLTPQIGRIILGQLEQEPKYESGIQLEGYRDYYDPWARQRLAAHLEVLCRSGTGKRLLMEVRCGCAGWSRPAVSS